MSATPYRDLADEALARRAADGDRDAFAQLFDRHLGSVFAAAWAVLHDRAVAAEIARDTFTAAWPGIGDVPAAEVAPSLAESGRLKAEAWLDENPQGRVVADTPAGDPPALGPVLRARIVTALEVLGVPTRVVADATDRPDPLLDTGPPPLGARLGEAIDRLRGWRPRRLVAAVGLGVGVVALVGGGTVALTGGDDDPDRSDDAVETAAAEPTPEPDRSRDADDPEPASTNSVPVTTTTGPPPPDTTATTDAAASDDDEDGPSPTPAARPATTAAPPTPATAPPRPPTTAPPAPTVPTILELTGYSSGRSDCPSGQIRFHMTWRTVESTWVWVHTEGAVWEDVAAPDGTTSRCTTYGTLWYLEIRRTGDWLEDTATIRA